MHQQAVSCQKSRPLGHDKTVLYSNVSKINQPKDKALNTAFPKPSPCITITTVFVNHRECIRIFCLCFGTFGPAIGPALSHDAQKCAQLLKCESTFARPAIIPQNIDPT